LVPGQQAALTTAVRLRPSRPEDLRFVTALERHPDNCELIGQWSDAEHLAAMAGSRGRSHWIVERDGEPAGYLIAYDCSGVGTGVYVKRLLVADKGRGTGRAALAQFLERAFASAQVSFVWLIVRGENVRAQALYASLGFERLELASEQAERFDRAAEPPMAEAFRMCLDRGRHLRA